MGLRTLCGPGTCQKISKAWVTGTSSSVTSGGSSLPSQSPGKQGLQSEGDARWLHQATEEENPIFLIYLRSCICFIWKHGVKTLLRNEELQALIGRGPQCRGGYRYVRPGVEKGAGGLCRRSYMVRYCSKLGIMAIVLTAWVPRRTLPTRFQHSTTFLKGCDKVRRMPPPLPLDGQRSVPYAVSVPRSHMKDLYPDSRVRGGLSQHANEVQ